MSYAPKVTPVLDTSAYTVGDVMFAPVEIPNVTSRLGGDVTLIGFQVTDESDQAPAFDIYLMDGNVSLGTINTPPSISDALASGDILGGPFRITTGDYVDLGGVRTAKVVVDTHIMNCAVDKTSVWIAAVIQSAVTLAVDSIKIRPMFL